MSKKMSLTTMGHAIDSIGTMSDEKFNEFKKSIVDDPDNSANFVEGYQQFCGQLQSVRSKDRMTEIYAECAPPIDDPSVTEVSDSNVVDGKIIVINERKILFPD